MMYFLGLHWGQFPEAWSLGEKKDLEEANESQNASLVTDGKYVKGMSGMTCVVPAEAVWEALTNMPTLKKELADKEKLLPKTAKGGPSDPISEAAPDDTSHRKRFNHLLDAAVKPPKSSGRT
jgi:hypothetical protein